VRVLVTGGTGYLGAAITRALSRRGHQPVVFARSTGGDVRDRAAVAAAASETDAIIHSAALVSLWRRRAADFDDVNVGGLENVLAAARDLKLARVVYTSSFLACAPAGSMAPMQSNDYQRTKALALPIAQRAAADGLPINIVVPGVIFGPGVMSEGNLVGRMVADHLKGKLPGLIGPHHVWSFAWVDDVANAHVDALEDRVVGKTIEAGGHNLPQMAPFEWLRGARGVRLPRTIPYWLATAIGAAEELRANLTGRMPLLTRPTVEIFRHSWPLAGSPSENFDNQMIAMTRSL
jgi:farnesol dehydrogenase